MEKEVFKLHCTTTRYATRPMSLEGMKARQDQQGLLSLLVLHQLPTSKFCHGNQTEWALVIKQIHW